MSDLTLKEQKNVRTALRYFRLRYGTWDALAKVLNCRGDTIAEIASGRESVPAHLAFRLARLTKTGVDALIGGAAVPPGTCAYCGHPPDFTDEHTPIDAGKPEDESDGDGHA